MSGERKEFGEDARVIVEVDAAVATVCLNRPAKKFMVRPCRILSRPFNIIRIFPRPGHAGRHRLKNLLRLHLQFVFHMQRTGRDESMDTPAAC